MLLFDNHKSMANVFEVKWILEAFDRAVMLWSVWVIEMDLKKLKLPNRNRSFQFAQIQF